MGLPGCPSLRAPQPAAGAPPRSPPSHRFRRGVARLEQAPYGQAIPQSTPLDDVEKATENEKKKWDFAEMRSMQTGLMILAMMMVPMDTTLPRKRCGSPAAAHLLGHAVQIPQTLTAVVLQQAAAGRQLRDGNTRWDGPRRHRQGGEGDRGQVPG